MAYQHNIHFPAPSAPRRAGLALAGLAVLCLAPPVAAQGEGSGGSPQNPTESLEPVAADGFKVFMELMEEFARMQFERLPSADKSARENAYGKLAAIQLAGAGSALLLPATGLAIGGGIGICVDVSAAGATVGTGTMAGGAIGLGAGMVVGGGAFVGSLLATLPMVDEIEAKYPAESAPAAPTGRRGRGNFAFGPETLETLEAYEASAKAGPFESYYVNLVSALPDPFIILFERWDRTPGLGNEEREWLRSIDFARPQLQRLAWIKRNQRVSANAPKADDLFLDVGRILSGDQAAIERAWLNAMGLGSTGLEVRNRKLTLDVPPPLRAVGLPAQLTADVPSFNVRAGGNGGGLDPFLRFRLTPGTFDLNWGTVNVVKSGANRGLIEVGYSLNNGARLGSASISFKAGGDETKIVDLNPRLGRKLEGKLFFRLDGLVMNFVKAEVMGLTLSFGIPKEIRDMPIVKDLLDGLLKDVESGMKDFVRNTLPFGNVFADYGPKSVAALGSSVQRDAGQHGLASITQVTRAEVHNGVMRLHVRGRELRGPSLGNSLDEGRVAWQSLSGKPVLRPLEGRLPTRPVALPKKKPVGK